MIVEIVKIECNALVIIFSIATFIINNDTQDCKLGLPFFLDIPLNCLVILSVSFDIRL